MLGRVPLYAVAGGAVTTVTSITPNTGGQAGGDPVTIAGVGFTGATSGDIDGSALASFTVVSDIEITAVTGSHLGIGAYDVDIVKGGNTYSLLGGFTYT
jgi:hypothetical protein